MAVVITMVEFSWTKLCRRLLHKIISKHRKRTAGLALTAIIVFLLTTTVASVTI